jgi:hypothetical protein
LAEQPRHLSDELEAWLEGGEDKTMGGLLDLFGERAFAVLIAMLVALQLIIGRDEIWLPKRWRKIELAGGKRERFLNALMRWIRRLERISKPRLRFLFFRRLSNIVFGVLVLALTVAAFLAPPFTGLDTLPALGVVLLSLGVLLRDFLIVVVGFVVGAAGVLLEIVLGTAAIKGIWKIF